MTVSRHLQWIADTLDTLPAPQVSTHIRAYSSFINMCETNQIRPVRAKTLTTIQPMVRHMAAPRVSCFWLGMLYDKLEPSYACVHDSTFGFGGNVSMPALKAKR